MKRRPSRLEEMLEWQLSAAHIVFNREYRFHAVRRWRFDFIIGLGRRIAVECEGVTRYGPAIGRHQSAKGIEADMEKYNTALIMGWRVLRVTENQIKSGQALKWIQELLKSV